MILLSLLGEVVLIVEACTIGGQVTQPAFGAKTLATQVVPVKGGGRNIDVNAAGPASVLETKDFLVFNVHIPYEGEIEGTDRLVPYREKTAQR